MSSNAYIQAVAEGLSKLQETQLEAINRAAETITEAIVAGNKIFSFGASHSFILAEELIYRTGGLMLINPIYPHGMNLSVRPMTLTSQLERLPGLGATLLTNSPAGEDDVLIIASTSGRNAVAIDMALAAKDSGIKTIAITSMAYSQGVSSRHPGGKKLYEICDLVIDNCAPLGDAAVEIPGFAQKTGPLSTVLGCTAVNAIVCQVIANLIAQDVAPPVFVSANMPGGDEQNQTLLAENRHRIFYMD